MKTNLIGNKEKNSGYIFAPYIKIMELHLPIKFLKFDENNQAIFVKYELHSTK